ncbi:MAG: TolC family protein [Pseudomonadales bacterium]|nr:TolC family protein [Pseudomonadales bacterium]
MSFRNLLLVLTLFSMSLWVNAQEALTGTISLRDAFEAVMQSNPRLRSFQFREEALLGQRESANLNPPLRANGGIEEFLGTGNLQDFSATELNIGLSQVIELGGKRQARLGVANRRIDLLAAEQRVVELDLLGETTQRFVDVVAAQELLELQRRATEIANQTIELLEPLVAAGRSPQLEQDRAEAARIRAEAAQAMAVAMLDSARIRLSAMWAISEPQFDTVDANLLAVGAAGSLQTLLSNLDSNPDIAIYASEERLHEAELRQANTMQQSNIEWSAGVRHLRELNDTAFTVGVSMPLFAESRAQGQIREARARLQEVEARRAVTLNRLTGEITSLYQRLNQTISEVNLLQDEVLPRLESVQEQSRDAYENGTYSYLELISAQQEYLDAELALINSATTAHKLRAEIERLSGEPLLAR